MMDTTASHLKAGFVLFLLGAFLAGCEKGDKGTITDPTSGNSPSAEVVNNSGGRIDHVNVGNITFTKNLSYNTVKYLTDNGSYCGDGCSTENIYVTEGASVVTVSQTATSGAVQVGSLGPFQKGKSYAVNVRKLNASYCAELWQRPQASGPFNDDATRVLISMGSCQ